MNAIAQFFRRI